MLIPEQGTGALKITPAHDFNDYDVGQRNKLRNYKCTSLKMEKLIIMHLVIMLD